MNRVLVVGGGITGNTLTILLSRDGFDVDLAEIKPDWNVSGSGITLQGNALRVLREACVWEQVAARGFGFDAVGITALDGSVLHVQQDMRSGGPELPASFGMERPALQEILAGEVRRLGARVRLGCTVRSLEQDAHGVDAVFSDGSAGRYDLVIGADGLHSATRALIGITDQPAPTGMAVWRVTAPRPPDVSRTDLTYGGPCYIAGYTPTSETTLYAFLVVPRRDRAGLPEAAAEMRRLAQGYGGAWGRIRESMTDPALISYVGFHRFLIEGCWHRGRVVLAGDAAHTCPPTLAQGAAISLEDALVLAELLASANHSTAAGPDLEEIFTAYYERRFPRVQMVVENSVTLGQWQIDGVRDADVPGLIGRTMSVLRERP